jgi:hypothetical protein
MGRNLKDFYGDAHGSRELHRSDVKGPNGGAIITQNKSGRITATPDNGESAASRKVTRNRDVKKQGKRLAEVAVGNKPRLRKDSY